MASGRWSISWPAIDAITRALRDAAEARRRGGKMLQPSKAAAIDSRPLHPLLRGEQPFLHVMRANAGAHGLYERMGFRDHAESVVRVVARC